MKRLTSYLLVILLSGFMISCEQDSVEQELEEFSAHVDEAEEDLADDQFSQNWEGVRSDYIDMKSNLVEQEETMTSEQRQMFQHTVDQWNNVAEQYYLMEDLETQISDQNSQLTDEAQARDDEGTSDPNRPTEEDENLSNSATNNYSNQTVDNYSEIEKAKENAGTDDAYNRTEDTDDYMEEDNTSGDYNYNPNDDVPDGPVNTDTVPSENIKALYTVVYTDAEATTEELFLNAVDSSNIVSVYKQFTEEVRENRKKYTSRDWAEVEILWEALNERKNAVEDNISTRENLDIAEYKLEYAAYKTVRKPIQAIEEKTDDSTSDN